VYYDDKVMMELNNYEGAATTLELMQDLSKKEFEKTFHEKKKAPMSKNSSIRSKMNELAEKKKKVISMDCLNAHDCSMRRANSTHISFCRVKLKRGRIERGLNMDQERGRVWWVNMLEALEDNLWYGIAN